MEPIGILSKAVARYIAGGRGKSELETGTNHVGFRLVPLAASSSPVDHDRGINNNHRPSLSALTALAGETVGATASPNAGDFWGLQHLSEVTGKRFVRGILLHAGSATVAFGQNLYAVSVSALWRVVGNE